MTDMKSSESDHEEEQIRLLKKAIAEIKQHDPSVYEKLDTANDLQSTKSKQKEESNLR